MLGLDPAASRTQTRCVSYPVTTRKQGSFARTLLEMLARGGICVKRAENQEIRGFHPPRPYCTRPAPSCGGSTKSVSVTAAILSQFTKHSTYNWECPEVAKNQEPRASQPAHHLVAPTNTSPHNTTCTNDSHKKPTTSTPAKTRVLQDAPLPYKPKMLPPSTIRRTTY